MEEKTRQLSSCSTPKLVGMTNALSEGEKTLKQTRWECENVDDNTHDLTSKNARASIATIQTYLASTTFDKPLNVFSLDDTKTSKNILCGIKNTFSTNSQNMVLFRIPDASVREFACRFLAEAASFAVQKGIPLSDILHVGGRASIQLFDLALTGIENETATISLSTYMVCTLSLVLVKVYFNKFFCMPCRCFSNSNA